MLLSLALAFLCAMILGWVMQRLHLPALLGMLLTGVLLGPYAANLLDASILGISSQLRQIALIIVLTRAGLGMDFGALKRVGRPAVLLCFVPACFEIAGTVLLAPVLLGLSVVESAVLGAVIAAVSPAVVVPKMLRLTQEKRGTDKGIPQLIMAGASVDDVFVIVLFTAFTDMAAGQNFSVQQLLRIPTSILLGVAAGVLCGLALAAFFTARHMRDSVKVLILLSVSFLLVSAEAYFTGAVGFSGLIAIVVYAAVLGRKVPAASAPFGEICKALGGGRTFAVRAGWCGSEPGCRLENRCGGSFADCGRSGDSNDGRLGEHAENTAERKRTPFLHGGIYAESHGTGGHWRYSFGDGACVRRYGAFRCGTCDFPDSALGSVCN